jgi:hypothetical protein
MYGFDEPQRVVRHSNSIYNDQLVFIVLSDGEDLLPVPRSGQVSSGICEGSQGLLIAANPQSVISSILGAMASGFGQITWVGVATHDVRRRRVYPGRNRC